MHSLARLVVEFLLGIVGPLGGQVDATEFAMLAAPHTGSQDCPTDAQKMAEDEPAEGSCAVGTVDIKGHGRPGIHDRVVDHIATKPSELSSSPGPNAALYRGPGNLIVVILAKTFIQLWPESARRSPGSIEGQATFGLDRRVVHHFIVAIPDSPAPPTTL